MTNVVFGYEMYRLLGIVIIAILLSGCNSVENDSDISNAQINGSGYTIERTTKGVFIYTDKPDTEKDTPNFKIINET